MLQLGINLGLRESNVKTDSSGDTALSTDRKDDALRRTKQETPSRHGAELGFLMLPSLTPLRGTGGSLSATRSLLKLEGKPGRKRLHAVTFNIVTIPNCKRDRH